MENFLMITPSPIVIPEFLWYTVGKLLNITHKEVPIMKKFLKFLCGVASMAAVGFGAYCVYKNVIAKKDDEDFDDFEDCFEDEESEEAEENREYVSINITEEAGEEAEESEEAEASDDTEEAEEEATEETDAE